MFPDPRQRHPRFEFPGSTGAGPRQFLIEQSLIFLNLNLRVGKLGFPDNSVGVESACNTGYLGSIPGSGRLKTEMF